MNLHIEKLIKRPFSLSMVAARTQNMVGYLFATDFIIWDNDNFFFYAFIFSSRNYLRLSDYKWNNNIMFLYDFM